jgi:hypothetical protein
MRILVILTMLFGQLSFAASIDENHDALVREEVASSYSQGWGDETFDFSEEDDIWGLEYASDEDGCIAFVKGFANKPSAFETVLYEFWVCISESDSGELEAEIWDDQQIGD